MTVDGITGTKTLPQRQPVSAKKPRPGPTARNRAFPEEFTGRYGSARILMSPPEVLA